MSISLMDLSEIEYLLDSVNKYYVEGGLKYGWLSNLNKSYDAGHWNNMILKSSRSIGWDHNDLHHIQEHPVIDAIWQNINAALGGDRSLVRAYVNGYTYGTDAYYHQDDTWIKEEFGDDSVSETVLIYLNKEWDRDWAGETNFADGDEIIASVLPKKNRCVVFDSNLWHRASPLTRACTDLRSVLVFKTAGKQYNRPWVGWIKERTENIPHSGVTMFQHLYDTAMTVDSFNGMPHYITKAALYHSVYDTVYFKAGLGVTKEQVIEQIGEDAERLVSIFCRLDNRFEMIYNNREKWDAETHFALCVIELANTLEQAPRQQPSEERNRRIQLLDDKISSFKLEWNNASVLES